MTNIVWNFITPNPAFYFYIDRLFFNVIFFKQAVDFHRQLKWLIFFLPENIGRIFCYSHHSNYVLSWISAPYFYNCSSANE